MTSEKMTIHKALAELKLLDGRIRETIKNGCYCVANKHSSDKICGIPIEDYKKSMQGSYDKAVDLISRRNAIKRAVVLSNAQTKVEISGVEYTVAEAIDMKNHGIELDVLLKEKMRREYEEAQCEAVTQNESLDKRASDYVTGLYGGGDGKANQKDIEGAKEAFIKMNTYDLIDPLNVSAKIEALESKIAGFTTEVDAALSVNNALTEITVQY